MSPGPKAPPQAVEKSLLSKKAQAGPDRATRGPQAEKEEARLMAQRPGITLLSSIKNSGSLVSRSSYQLN